MSEKTFTPGPWRINDDRNEGIADDEYHFIAAGDGLCSPPKYKGFEIAGCMSIEDARLIAAAPDLLEAVQAMLEWDAREEDQAVGFRERLALCAAAFDKARAAYAKATGAQS